MTGSRNDLPITINPTAAAFVRPAGGVSGITYSLQFSTDLETWSTLSETSAIPNGDGTESVSLDLTSDGRGFVRLLVGESSIEQASPASESPASHGKPAASPDLSRGVASHFTSHQS